MVALYDPRSRCPLQDLKVYEGSVDCLAPEYQEILTRSDEIEAEFKRQPCHLERLYGKRLSLYTANVKSRDPQSQAFQVVGTVTVVGPFLTL